MLLTGMQANKPWLQSFSLEEVNDDDIGVCYFLQTIIEMVYLDSINFQAIEFIWCRYVRE